VKFPPASTGDEPDLVVADTDPDRAAMRCPRGAVGGADSSLSVRKRLSASSLYAGPQWGIRTGPETTGYRSTDGRS